MSPIIFKVDFRSKSTHRNNPVCADFQSEVVNHKLHYKESTYFYAEIF